MATTAITYFPMVAPVKPKGFYILTPSRPSRVSMPYVSCPPRISMQCVPRLSSVPMKYASFDWRRSIKHSDRGLSAAAAAAAATAGETKTVTPKSPTLTRVPGKAKGPKIADGGGGFPPREDNRGGGGGGGGENSSGGFVLFGILAFLGFLKELDRDDQRGRRR